MNVFAGFARFVGFFLLGCMYFSLWKCSVPATAVVTAVHWWTCHRPSRLGNPYRSMLAEPTVWLSPSHVVVSVGLLTTVFTVLTEQ